MDQLNLSETEWRRRLSPRQYHVLREAGPEPDHAGLLADTVADGCYHCAACHLALFDSADKYDAGTGRPCFTRPIEPARITDHGGPSPGPSRAETRCARCDSHLGHVFADGPPPTGLRYCLHSLALDFRARKPG